MSPRALGLLLVPLFACAGCGGEPPDVAPIEEVRGAALSGFGRAQQPENAGAPPTAAEARPPRAAEDLGHEYAEVLPPAEAAKYAWVDFLELTDFDLESYAPGPDGGPPAGLPTDLVQLAGKLVAVEGFMNPTAFDRDGVSQFTLVADPSFCCFGVTPTLHHFIQVDMPKGEFTEFFSIVPIAVFGRLEIGLVEEDGIALSFYRMRADHVFCVY